MVRILFQHEIIQELVYWIKNDIMYSDELIINTAKSKIGYLDQNEINQQEYLDVHFTINDAEHGPKSFMVKFHREKINNAIGWMFVELVRK